jgi:CHAT domain-containing protein
VYNAPSYEVEMIENDAQLAYLQMQVDRALSRGSPVEALYARLRGEGWNNLPGTLNEVKVIQEVVNEAKILTGEDVNEATIKELSATGELANYTVLHFATHGDADARIPELSALVLSLFPGSAGVPPASKADETSAFPGAGEAPALPGGEDGYLRAGEIHQLDIKADFVNLSACETGLGKLYSGEGMVGLTQAFLLAGANGLSVSLWSVADESTAAFMITLYKLVEGQDLNYAEAISEVKRRFINGDFDDNWKAPYYWAPFVYYGR